jgi:hypothetical protein
MITPQDAEKLANKTIEDYVNACGCRNEQDVANVLMKLSSMCGLGMCAVVGQVEAVDRMRGTADHIAMSKVGTSWKREVVQ